MDQMDNWTNPHQGNRFEIRRFEIGREPGRLLPQEILNVDIGVRLELSARCILPTAPRVIHGRTQDANEIFSISGHLLY
jgi:hypothetical protein